MVDFTGTLRLEVETARSDVFVWGLSTWSGYRFGGPADTATSGTEWLNVLGETHEIKVRRGGKANGFSFEIEAGDLQATVLDPQVDPSSSPYIKPGTPIRLMHDTEAVFTGELRQVKVTYHSGQPRVFLSAIDRVKDLANTMRYGADEATFTNRVIDLLRKHGFDYRVYGDSATMLARNNYDSTVLNHLTLASTSEQGRWFVCKHNHVHAFTKSEPVAEQVYTFTDKPSTGPTEIEYVDIGVSYDSDELVNEIVINNLTYAENEEQEPQSVSTKFGPYRNGTSIATYGVFNENIETNLPPADIDAYAAEALGKTGYPALHVSNVRANMSQTTDVAAAFEVYDSVGIEYENEYVHINDTYTVLSIEHEISASNTDHKWMTTLQLNKLGGN